MKLKHPTYVSLVLEQLKPDDFMDIRMLVKATGCTSSQVSAALHHLRKHRAADVVVEADGKGWWFALPANGDTRNNIVEERAYEGKPRKRRKNGLH